MGRKPCSARLPTSSRPTPAGRSSETLEAASTGTERVLKPWWTAVSTAISRELRSCTGTDYVALDSTLWNWSLRNLASGSWFRTTLETPRQPPSCPRTCLPLSTFSWRKTMASEQARRGEQEAKETQEREETYQSKVKGCLTKAKNHCLRKDVPFDEEALAKATKLPARKVPLKTRKIRIRVSPTLRDIFKGWFGCARWTYNQAVAAVREAHERGDEQMPTLSELRNRFSNNSLFKETSQVWLLKTPNHIRAQAIADALKAYKTCISQLKSKQIKHFHVGFKSKLARSDSIFIEKGDYKSCGLICPTFTLGERFTSREQLPSSLMADTRLIRIRTGHSYLSHLVPLERRRSKNLGAHTQVIALDPGNRKFICGYDNDGNVYQWAVHDQDILRCLAERYDALQSKSTSVAHKHRYRMRKLGRRLNEKLRFKVTELHCKLVKWLLDNFDLIILPEYNASKMVISNTLQSRSARSMLTWRPYDFKQRLLFKQREYPKTCVLTCTEEFTSQHCSLCGHLDKSSDEIHRCSACRFAIDRDHAGAFNIMVKHITEMTTTERVV